MCFLSYSCGFVWTFNAFLVGFGGHGICIHSVVVEVLLSESQA